MESIQYDKKTTALDLGALLDAHEDAVVILVAGDTRLAAHRAVLEARSPVFAAMFGNDMLEASSGQVAIPDVEGLVLRQLVAYLYTLQAPQLPVMAPQLLAAADKYGVSSLKTECERQLAKQLSVETAASIAFPGVRHSGTSLKQHGIKFIKTHTHQVMETQGCADAIHMQPEDAGDVGQLLADPLPENSSCSQTLASTALPTGNSSHSPSPDDAAISRLRQLSAWGKGVRLRAAVKHGSVEELEALLAAGAKVNGGYSATPLHWAAKNGHEMAVRRLLAAGAAVGARDSTWGRATPLHWAAKEGHASVVRLLLAAGADHGARNERGNTPLHVAAFWGHTEAAAALLVAGADTAARNRWGQTPLDSAMSMNQQKVVQLLWHT